MSKKIRNILCENYPHLSEILHSVKIVPKLKSSNIEIPEMIMRVVVNQMLSKSAATSIYNKLEIERINLDLDGTWQLDKRVMRKCGLSNSKCRTIIEFRKKYYRKPETYHHWHNLQYNDLKYEVKDQWGLSNWSASILGIFYFAHEDVFPENDISIQRAIDKINYYMRTEVNANYDFTSQNSQPYRSYLALYLWRVLDEGVLSNHYINNNKNE